jgi:CRP-like cAMP-binding protein
METATQTPLAAFVRRLELRSTLTSEDRAALHDLPLMSRRFAADKQIVVEGQRATHACLLVSGFAIREKVVASGQRQILALHLPGDMVDLQNVLLTVADHGVRALTDVVVAMVPIDAVVRLAFRNPGVGEAMWRDTLVDAALFREWTAAIGRRDAATRLAHLLCEMGVRLEIAGLGQRDAYQLPVSQEVLGDCLGLTSVHVNRTLRQLEEEGVIVREKRALRIVDWRTMTRRGDFDLRYLHLEPA